MKKLTALALALLFTVSTLSCFAASIPEELPIGEILEETDLYKKASLKKGSITTIKEGDEVEIIGETKSFYRVVYGLYCGYVLKDAVDVSIGKYKEGTYTASKPGFGGPVEVKITINENGDIAKVKITGNGEYLGIGSRAIDEMPERIMEAQSAEIDAVAGASFTSTAIIDATEAILKKAAK